MMQEFAQQIEETARAVVDEIHTAMPGTVISFDPSSGTAAVKPSGKYVIADGIALDYPQISDVPVVFPFCQAAGVGIAFPVNKGDSCLLIISEVELDEWRSGAESEGTLRFDLASAICIPGLQEGGFDAMKKAFRNNAVIVSGGGSEIMVSDDCVTITAGAASISVSGSDIAVRGNLRVYGNIITPER